jgi:hypothetical protein
MLAGCLATVPAGEAGKSDTGSAASGSAATASGDKGSGTSATKPESPSLSLPSLQLPEFLRNLPGMAAQTPLLTAGIPLKALPRGTPPLAVSGRSQRSMQALFQKGKVSGDELVAELKTMRETMRAQRSARAIQSFMGSLESAPAAAASPMRWLIQP